MPTYYVGFYRNKADAGMPKDHHRWFYLNREATTDKRKVEKIAEPYYEGDYEVVIKEVELP